MVNFITGMRKATNIDFTENSAISKRTSESAVLDFFAKSGALRGQDEEAFKYIVGAYSEDKELALKALFYARDVRGGQGERAIFRIGLRYIAQNYPEDIRHLLPLIPEYGRWDDLYLFVGTHLEDEAFDIMKNQFFKDMKSDHPSLLAKWLKSVNTSSKASRNLGRYTASKFEMNEPKYRKALAKVRKRIDVVERKMSSKRWKDIEYSKVPSQAMYKHKDAFRTHDPEGFAKFMEDVKKGKVELKAGTLYPYQIVKKILESTSHIFGSSYSQADEGNLDYLKEAWNNLPNYIEGEETAIAVVDTSGSMYMSGNPSTRPIDISVSLGVYFAERNVGPFKDSFITFSALPNLKKIEGNNIIEKVINLSDAHWEMNTNIQAVFDTILDVAEENNLSQEEIPNKVYILSDMQFDRAVSDNSKTNFELIDENFRLRGYKRPDLVFWNVNAYSDIPVEKDEHGTYLVSGASPSILKYAMNCDSVTPYQLMLDVLYSDRYAPISL